MLYVFLVDTGTMKTFDMNFACENVSTLKGIIEKTTKIPHDKQVLIISGGEVLDPSITVCNYSAGTDTNPIFLFSKVTIEDQSPPPSSGDVGTDIDIKKLIEDALRLPPCYETVASRVHLAQRLCDASREQIRKCQQLVHEQHLQQQGWAAVVANLEDVIIAFKQRFDNFESAFTDFLQKCNEQLKILNNFNEDLELLSQIPVLPALLKGDAKDGICDSTFPLVGSDKSKQSVLKTGETVSLLQWISAKDSESNLEMIVGQCHRGLSQIDESLRDSLTSEFHGILSDANRSEMKEIKGLEDRLYGLEQLMHDGNRFVQDQQSHAVSLLQNQTRAGKIDDPSIFPELCNSHKRTLLQMKNNYLKLQEIQKKCIGAKIELSQNLHFRLSENVRRLSGHLHVLEQIHMAPKIYLCAVTEVARRHLFSEKFMQWATKLSAESTEVWNNEVQVRQQFLQQFSSHFLRSLFPGLEEMPPQYATQAPENFDHNLPKLTVDDVEELRNILPDMDHFLDVKEVGAVPPLLQLAFKALSDSTMPSNSINGIDRAGGICESTVTALYDTASEDAHLVCSQDNECCSKSLTTYPRESLESETDTEGFEKVCSSSSDGVYSPMEEDASCRGFKNKQHFHCQSDDAKHIKLDSNEATADATTSQDESAPVATSEGKAKSPESCESQEFITAEFYIDESMPSSYIDNNGVHKLLTSAHRKQSNLVSAELQKRIDEKNKALAQLQENLNTSLVEVEKLQKKLRELANLGSREIVSSFRSELNALREKVRGDNASYLNYMSNLAAQLLDVLLKVQAHTTADMTAAVQEAVVKTSYDHEKRQRELEGTVDVQVHQLGDAHREIEVYQNQLTLQQESIQLMLSECNEKEKQLLEEKQEVIKQLTLEHELEMESLKESWKKDEDVRYEEIAQLKKDLDAVSASFVSAKQEIEKMENNFNEKLQLCVKEEKDKIVKILEVSFAEREKNSLEALREQLSREHNDKLQSLSREKKIEMHAACEGVRGQILMEGKEVLEKQKNELQEKHEKSMQELRMAKEEEMKKAILEVESHVKSQQETEKEILRNQHRQEIEDLRSRFRVMTTNIERSPSEMSLEKFEKGDFMEIETHRSLLLALREELTKEKEVALSELKTTLKEKHTEIMRTNMSKLEEQNREEMQRIDEERQVAFNREVQKVTLDKERIVEDWKIRVDMLNDELEKMKKLAVHSVYNATEQQLQQKMVEVDLLKKQNDEYQTEIHSLEKKLMRAKRRSFTGVSSHDLTTSIAESTTSSPETIRKVQREDQENKTKLSSSATALVDDAKVSIHSCGPGDIVLFVWDEAHAHFRVFLEGIMRAHFLHDDSTLPSNIILGEKPKKLYFLAQVVRKEYCQVKRRNNRFHLTVDARFYRVLVRPYPDFTISSVRKGSGDSQESGEPNDGKASEPITSNQ